MTNIVSTSKITLIVFLSVLKSSEILCDKGIDDTPIVDISTGKIQGKEKTSRQDREFFAYRGIPYAAPPVGLLRFESPEPAEKWEGIFDATEYGHSCVQFHPFKQKVVGSEDCLTLNVFTPKFDTPTRFSPRPLPVMVWIHGGKYAFGGSNIYKSDYFMDENVILVTINYRLGPFGFLSTGDDIIKGNMGMKDQVLALQWVQENIAKFGGDQNGVTIFGESAGASSVAYLMLSPMSKGLFHKAISQSGSALKLKALQTQPQLSAQRLATLLECNTVLNSTEDNSYLKDNSELALCLKEVDAEDIAMANKDVYDRLTEPLAVFAPSIETHNDQNDTFMSEHPYSAIVRGQQSHVPWMVGINSREGVIATSSILNDEEFLNDLETEWNSTIPKFLFYEASRIDITQSIKEFYFPESYMDSTQTHRRTNETKVHIKEKFDSLTNLVTDRIYAFATIDHAILQANYSPVFFYYNDYDGEFSLKDVLKSDQAPSGKSALRRVKNWFKRKIIGSDTVQSKDEENDLLRGPSHGDQLPLLFQFSNLKIKEGAKDFEPSKQLITTWVQFARNEKELRVCDARWHPLNPKTLHVMTFVQNFCQSGMKPLSTEFKKRVQFWENLKYQYLPSFTVPF